MNIEEIKQAFALMDVLKQRAERLINHPHFNDGVEISEPNFERGDIYVSFDCYCRGSYKESETFPLSLFSCSEEELPSKLSEYRANNKQEKERLELEAKMEREKQKEEREKQEFERLKDKYGK